MYKLIVPEKHTKLWDLSVQLHDKLDIEILLEDGYLPNKEQLKTACMVFPRSSEIIDIITCKICKKIYLTNPSKILRVWAGYRSGEESDIVFVVVTKEENADIDFAFDYDLVIRGKEEFSLENRSVIYQENVQDLFPTKEVMLDVQRCINKYVESLTKDHSNLRIIAGSSFKSKRYMKPEPEPDLIKRTCIVFYVHIKGVIPIKEKEFPKTLTSENSIIYETDVREGYVDLKAGGWPDEIHTDVKMGCKIGGMENEDEFGTLGGFLELPRYGLCCLTCAHVLVTEAKGEYEDDEFICYQPNVGNRKTFGQKRRFGCLRKAHTYAGDTGSDPPKAGLDYALVKLDEDRKPCSGLFPDIDITEWKTAGFDFPMTYTSGEVFNFDETYRRRRNPIIKYGARTGVTCGSLAWYGQCIVQEGRPTLLNQIQINHTRTDEKKQEFSGKGDSGSLVFMVDNQNTPTAIGLLVCGNAKLGCSYATPICEILDDINIEKMKSFNQL
ncbi:uncharacterized protein LOC128552020 [Mercenaria mercenaria]|uniref:uncharacterized protein LOC128552020 n=1 Tax=Mercenaria mercenaria TaxID=6596 RepID=UPI00234F0133|nr:uncharacterized protein LOC128552020 [Mercenaria mercenaria]